MAGALMLMLVSMGHTARCFVIFLLVVLQHSPAQLRGTGLNHVPLSWAVLKRQEAVVLGAPYRPMTPRVGKEYCLCDLGAHRSKQGYGCVTIVVSQE